MIFTVKGVVKMLVIIAVSIGISFIPTFIIAESNYEIASSSIPFFLWGLFTIISIFLIRSLLKRFSREGGDKWGSPEATRPQVVNTPQFVGRFDKANGLLESTVRMVEQDRTEYQTAMMYTPKSLNVIRFRGELLDKTGAPLEYVPVEIKGESRKWVGSLTDGDRVRVKGKVEKDGILHTKKVFNYSTNSWVGEK